MNRSLHRALIALVMLLGLCAPAAAFAAGPPPTPPEAKVSADMLVWGEDAKGVPITVWIRVNDGAVETLAQRSEVVLSTGSSLLRVRQVEQTLWLGSCACINDGQECDRIEANKVQALEVQALESGQLRRLGEFPSSMYGDITGSSTLIGSFGPYMIMVQGGSDYSCGAHGNGFAGFSVLDVSKDFAPLPILKDPALVASLADERKAAFEAMKKAQKDITDIEGAGALGLSAFLPSIGAQGEVSFEYLFTGSACYACGDGEWGSYSVSESVPSKDAPPAFAPHLTLSKPVQDWLGSEKPLVRIRGWSAVGATDASERDYLLTVFRQR